MRSFLKELYSKVVYYGPEQLAVGKRLDEEIATLLEPYKAKLSEKEVEELQNLMYTVVYSAEYEGFCMGAKTTVGLLLELLSG